MKCELCNKTADVSTLATSSTALPSKVLLSTNPIGKIDSASQCVHLDCLIDMKKQLNNLIQFCGGQWQIDAKNNENLKNQQIKDMESQLERLKRNTITTNELNLPLQTAQVIIAAPESKDLTSSLKGNKNDK